MNDETVQKILQAMALGFQDVNTRIDEGFRAVNERFDKVNERFGALEEDIAVIKQDVRVLKDEVQHTNARLARIEEKLELPPLRKKFG